MKGRPKKPARRRTTSYVPVPTISEAHVERYRMVMAAATGQLSVSEAAKRLGMSRNHFQTLLHRGEGALIEAIVPHPAGRKRRSAREVELEQEVERLQRQVSKLQAQSESSDQLLTVVSQMLKGKVRLQSTPATRRKKTTRKKAKTPDGEEPEPAVQLQQAMQMKSKGIPWKVSAAAMGLGDSTLRRWAPPSTARSSVAPSAWTSPRARGRVGRAAGAGNRQGAQARRAGRGRLVASGLPGACRGAALWSSSATPSPPWSASAKPALAASRWRYLAWSEASMPCTSSAAQRPPMPSSRPTHACPYRTTMRCTERLRRALRGPGARG